MAELSKLKVNGVEYDLKDAFSREQIETLKQTVAGGVQYVGISTTELTDGATTATVAIKDGESTKDHAAEVGDMVDYNNILFVFNKSKQWDQLGSAGALKALAYKDSVSADYTPAGTISKPDFTGTEGDVSVSGTPSGTISAPGFTGTKATINVSGTPSGTVTQPTFTGSEGTVNVSGTPKGSVAVTAAAPVSDETANYTPAGSVTVTPDTANVQQITGVGTLPSLKTEVVGETLEISFDAGTLPTSEAVEVATGVKSAAFTGEGTVIKGAFTGEASSASGNYTPAGTVSQPTFEGAELSMSADYTPAGSVAAPTFTGDALTATGKFTPAGEVSQPEFTGSKATIESK